MKTIIYVISENNETIEKIKSVVGSDTDCTVKVLSSQQWDQQLDKPETMKVNPSLQGPTLVSGSVKNETASGGKVLNFKSHHSNHVESMDKLEARAIESAIAQFKGNLTEAARALGIGRATLYRKVKHYQIDPATARRRKVA